VAVVVKEILHKELVELAVVVQQVAHQVEQPTQEEVVVVTMVMGVLV